MTTSESEFQIAIIIPVLNEEKSIGRTLDQIYMQDYPMDKVEVVIVDGGSTDRTRDIAGSFRKRFGSLKVLDNPRRLALFGRNPGIKNSVAPYVLILDGHVFLPSKTLLRDLMEIFHTTQASCLCRQQPLTPLDIGEFEKSVALCRESFLGHKPGSEIPLDFEGELNPISLGAMYVRSVFDKIGYFDEAFDACQDVDFNFRVQKAGLKSFISPRLKVFCYPRSSLPGLWRQMSRYGAGRFRFWRKHKQFSPVQWMAATGVAGFVILMLLSLFSSAVGSVFTTLVGFYLLVDLFFSAILAHRENHVGCLLLGPLIFPTVHFGLGFGFLSEMLNWLLKKPGRAAAPLDIDL